MPACLSHTLCSDTVTKLCRDFFFGSDKLPKISVKATLKVNRTYV